MMTMIERKMPDRVELGSGYNGPMSSAMRCMKGERFDNQNNLRTVLGFILPTWQRPFVWTEQQSVSFIESAWRGIPIGSYTVNIKLGSRFDGWLIDGQQRMRALELYLYDAFPVFGYRWSEVTDVDRRVWESVTIFNYYETQSDDEAYLRSYYNLMNFGGTAHEKGQEA